LSATSVPDYGVVHELSLFRGVVESAHGKEVSMMTGPAWQFKEVTEGSTENEQIQEEFFSNAEVVSEVSGLIRESIQNSLDEVLDSTKPVRMVFTVGRQTPDVTDHYFGELYPHVTQIGLPELPEFNKPSKFLIIEDFNTLGMEGPTFSTRPSDEGTASGRPYKNSYWFFTWTTGGSNKSPEKRGSWGVGKIVFPRASSLKSYLVLSNRRAHAAPQGDTAILFGRSILKYRMVGERRYVPDGQWMVPIAKGPIPSSDVVAHDRFRKEWNLTRETDELGTSIVIPFVREGLSAEELAECIIRDYFISILTGLLECEVKGEDGSTVLISKNTVVGLIRGLGDGFDSSGTRTKAELGHLSLMYLAFLSGDVASVEIPVDDKKPNEWSRMEVSESVIQAASDAFNADRVLQVKIQVRVPARTQTEYAATTDEFIVLFKRIYDIHSSTVFCRQGLLIPAANLSSRMANFISMVLVGEMTTAGKPENSIASLLRSAEGPSHETWSKTATNFKGRYKPKTLAENAIHWVRFAVLKSIKLLMGQDDQRDDTALGKYFPFNDVGPKPGSISVVLRGTRDRIDEESGLLSWRVSGIDTKSHTLKCINPVVAVVDQGSAEIGSAKVSLKPRSVSHRFQLTISDGSKDYLSNVFTFRPLDWSRQSARVEIVQCDGGFFIRNRGPRFALGVGDSFTITVEYKNRRGKGGAWDPEDFMLADLYVSSKTRGLQIIRASDNSVQFQVVSTDFYAEWSGFDPLRDLAIESR
jgi:hypothetical protein